MSPLVSIIMPVYNAESYIKEAIACVVKQTYSNWELLIINDGSTDNSLQLAQSYSNEKIKVYSIENSGQCAANNFGYRLAIGDYIKFFDADDVLSPNLLEEQVTALNHSQTAISSCSWGRFYNDDISTFKLSPEACWKNMEPVEWICSSWKNGEPMMQCALWLIPRKILEKSGLWNEKLSLINDFEFFTRVILAATEVRFAADATLYYRSGIKNSLSAKTTRHAVESAVLSAQLAVDALLKKQDNATTRSVAANCLINLAYQYALAYPDLLKPIEQRVKQLGGSSLAYRGSKATALLAKLLGWKTTQKLQRLYRKQQGG